MVSRIRQAPDMGCLVRVMRLLMAVFITVFFICGFELGVIFPPRPEKDSTVVIEKGMSAGDVAALLKKAHIIRSEFAFTIAARIARVESRFVPGRFEFSE